MDAVREASRRRLAIEPEDLPAEELVLHGEALGLGRPASRTEAALNHRRATRRILDRLDAAARFRFDDRAVSALLPLVEQPRRLEAAARHLLFPASLAWFEATVGGLTYGALIEADDDLRHGGGLAYLPVGPGGPPGGSHVPCQFTLGLGRDALPPANDVARSETFAILSRWLGRDVGEEATRIGHLLLAAIALLSTPRLCASRLVTMDRLNRQRVARGKWPLLAYHEVTVDLADPHAGGEVVRATGTGAPRPLHFVRAHLRLRSSGRIELVRPHWRGDAQLGIKRPAYRLTAPPGGGAMRHGPASVSRQ